MRPAAVLLLAVAALCCGCAPSSPEGPSAKRESIPTTARVVCGKDGARAVTPRVEARRDGVHYAVENRYGTDAGYAMETSEGGAGGNLPKGGIERVGDFPPGEVRIGCDEPPLDGLKVEFVTLQVLEGESGYKPVELECAGGMAVGGGPQYAPGTKGKKGEPVELARRAFADKIREDDVVETAGYPESRGLRNVRVVSDGRVVAVVVFARHRGGWLQDNYTACEGF